MSLFSLSMSLFSLSVSLSCESALSVRLFCLSVSLFSLSVRLFCESALSVRLFSLSVRLFLLCRQVHLCYFRFHTSRITWYLSFCLALSMITSSCIHPAVNGIVSFFMAE